MPKHANPTFNPLAKTPPPPPPPPTHTPHGHAGLTSGASTPDKFMENALERVFMLQALKQDLAAA